MEIEYSWVAYSGAFFKNKNGENIPFSEIKDKFMELNGRKGKVIDGGYIDCSGHGYSGGYVEYKFVFQDDLTSVSLTDLRYAKFNLL